VRQTNRLSIQNLCIASLLLATGILLPAVFHLIGGPAAGGMLLPMHIPVLIAGMMLGPFYGAVVGVFIPVVSLLLTGMPDAAKLPFMILQLVSFGFVSGYLQSKKCGLYFSLICAQITGWLVNAAALLIASEILKLHFPPVATVVTALITGIPGIIIQLIFIPVIVRLLRKVIHVDRYSES